MAVVLEVLNLGTLRLQLLWGIEGNIRLIGIQQLLDILFINVATLALTIGTLVATERNAFIELDTQPLKTLDDILLGSRHKTCGVGIFNTEHQIAAMLTGKQVIIECGTYAANM